MRFAWDILLLRVMPPGVIGVLATSYKAPTLPDGFLSTCLLYGTDFVTIFSPSGFLGSPLCVGESSSSSSCSSSIAFYCLNYTLVFLLGDLVVYAVAFKFSSLPD